MHLFLDKKDSSSKRTTFDKVVFLLVVTAFISRFCALAFPSIDLFFQVLGIAASVLSAALVFNRAKLMRFEYAYLFMLLSILVIQGVYTIGFLGQTFFHFFSAAYSYSFCLLLFPCAHLFHSLGGRGFLDALQKVAFAIALFMLFSALLKNFANITLMEAFRERGGRARFSEPELVDIMVIYSCWRIGTGKRRAFDCLCLLVGALTLLYVSQTRAMLAVVFASCFMTFLLCIKGANKKALLFCVGFFAALIAIVSGAVGEFVSSFSTTGLEASSTITRLEEAEFYLSAFFANPILGLGMIAYESPLHYLIGGAYGNYYPEDIGIIGALGTIGLLAVPLYVIPVFAIIRRAVKAGPGTSSLFFGFVTFLLGTSATLLIAYPFCSPVWPLLISVHFHYQATDIAERLRG